MARRDTYSSEKWLGMARDSSYRAARLSKMLGLSRRQLQRLTQRLFRRSPQAWLDEQRMIAAPSALKETRSAKETASDLGFKQRSHFSRKFKEYYGFSATDYLENPNQSAQGPHQSTPGQQISGDATGQW